MINLARKSKRWIQKAVEREGRVKTYLRRTYGSRAFNKDGTIKVEYINKAIKRIKDRAKKENRKLTKDERSLLSALYLAKRLKKMSRKKKKKR